MKHEVAKVSKNNGGIICGIERNDVEKWNCRSIMYNECSDRVRGTLLYRTL